MTTGVAGLLDTVEIGRTLGVLTEPGQTFEVRILEAQRAGYQYPLTMTGCFDNPALLPSTLRSAMLSGAKGFYITLNPVDPVLLARSHSHLRVARRGETTADANILRRRWLLVDCDPVRPSGLSATDPEKSAAEERALAVRETLRSAGWPEPVLADSGNGFHLLYRVELPTGSDLVKRCLEALALRFDDATVSIDRTVFNPSRIVKLYGTLTQKGDHCPDLGRVHRMSRLLEVPEPVEVVSVALLEGLAGLAEQAPSEQPSAGGRRRIAWGSRGGAWDKERMQAFIDQHLGGCEPGPATAYDGGWKWVLSVCPFNPEHTNGSAVVIIGANGALGFRCLHNGCVNYHWKDLRAKFEPGMSHANAPSPTGAPVQVTATVPSAATNEYGAALIGGDGHAAINQMHFAASYVHESGTIHDPAVSRFYTYDPATGLWQHQTDETTLRELGVCVQRILTEENRPDLLAKRTASQLQGLREMARGIAERRNVFNQRRNVIHVANGMLALKEDGRVELKPFAPEWYSRNRSEIAWNPQAECPRFKLELLLSAIDEDDAWLIQRYAGQSLLGANLSQTLLILRGTPGGGKSTLANVVEGLIGRVNVTELRVEQLSERFEMIRYVGRTLLTGKDVPGDFLNMKPAHVIKALVGGDTLEGELKHGNESFSVEGRYNVMIGTNARLRVKLDSDAGAWRRRMLIVDYNRPQPEKAIIDFDKLLLREEGEGILRWAVEGAIGVMREMNETGRFQLTAAQLRRVDDLLSESDSVRSFVHECLESCHGAEVSITEMTGHYRDYCEARDWAPLRERMFQADLPDAMLEFFRSPRRNDIRRDGKNVRGFRGVKMKAWSGENVDAQDTTDRLGGSDDLPGRVPGERDSAAAW
jgi:P4 family phage/plasmid primase-like protien